MQEKPYLIEKMTVYVCKYNPNFGDNKICVCGHSYYRHFDTYDSMRPVGCKYCECNEFQERSHGIQVSESLKGRVKPVNFSGSAGLLLWMEASEENNEESGS